MGGSEALHLCGEIVYKLEKVHYVKRRNYFQDVRGYCKLKDTNTNVFIILYSLRLFKLPSKERLSHKMKCVHLLKDYFIKFVFLPPNNRIKQTMPPSS